MENLLDKETVKRVKQELEKFNKSYKVQILDQSARTALDASKALSCNVGAIVKSLLIKTDDTFVLCLISGDKRCSLNKLKKITGKKDCLLYTSPSPRDQLTSRMPSSA